MWYLAIAKMITGGSFAGINSLQTLLLLEVVSADNYAAAFVVTEPFLGAGACFGPVIGFYLQLLQRKTGVSERHAYNLFFYISAALYAASIVNMVVLRVRLRANRPREGQAGAGLSPPKTVALSGADGPHGRGHSSPSSVFIDELVAEEGEIREVDRGVQEPCFRSLECRTASTPTEEHNLPALGKSRFLSLRGVHVRST